MIGLAAAVLAGAGGMYVLLRGGERGGGGSVRPAGAPSATPVPREPTAAETARLTADWLRRLAEDGPADNLAWFRRHFRPGLALPDHERWFADYRQAEEEPFAAYLFLWHTAGDTQYIAHLTVDLRDGRVADVRADALRLVDAAPAQPSPPK